MKLSLTVEADSINVLALNMGRISVDIDGIELSELINVVCDNSYSLRIADAPGKLAVEDPLPPIARINGIQCSTAHITEADNTLLFTLHTRTKTLATASGLCTPGQAIYSTWGRGRFRYYASNVSVCRKPVVAWWWRLCVVTPSALFILMPVAKCYQALPPLTGNPTSITTRSFNARINH